MISDLIDNVIALGILIMLIVAMDATVGVDEAMRSLNEARVIAVEQWDSLGGLDDGGPIPE